MAILETNNDITECRRAEEALRESEEQWRTVFENNPTMYFMVDAAGIILSVNPFGAEQFGYTVEELVGHSVLNVFYEADREAVQRNVAICFEQLGRTMSWEFRKVRKDGTVFWVRETAKAMLMKNRPVVLIVCEDITERKRMDRPRELIIRSQPEEAEAIRVAVQDAGPGIDPQDLERIFTALFTTKPAGLGMGLAISRSIIEAHGGRLWATPNDAPGATFHFTLPVDRS